MERPSFLIRIYGQQNATWQGQVTYLDEKKTYSFRSALELLKLIDSTLEMKTEEIEEDMISSEMGA